MSCQMGLVTYHTKRVWQFVKPKCSQFVMSKQSISLSYQKGILACYAKWVYQYVIPQGCISLSYEKGLLVFHTKIVQYFIISKLSNSLSYKRALQLSDQKDQQPVKPKGSINMLYQKGILVFHNKRVYQSVILNGCRCLSY